MPCYRGKGSAKITAMAGLFGLPDFDTLIPNALAQAKATGIQLEDHAIEQLGPFLSNVLAEALKDVQTAEGPILQELQAWRGMLAPACAAIVGLGRGLEITPKSNIIGGTND